MSFYDAIRIGASGAADFEIERSLRFNDDDTAYLSRNFGTGGNRKKWTFSAWIKRGNLGGSAGEMRIFGGSTNASHIFITSNDALTWDVAAPGSSASANLTTSQLFRDPSAWFHLVCAFDTDNSTADNRMRIYINGTEVTSFGTRTNPSSGYALNAINADANSESGDRSLHTIGYRTSVQGSAGMEFDGYMAEINFIDGQQYDPSYFGETNSDTGQWIPKKYTGGYGTTGFYLPLTDNSGTTATTLGKDSSGNSNNFTPNNFSVSAGIGNDSVTDTPTNNFCTYNPLNETNSVNLTEGNLKFSQSANDQAVTGTMAITSGKWYYEFLKVSGDNPEVGIIAIDSPNPATNGQKVSFAASSGGDITGFKIAFITNNGQQRNGINYGDPGAITLTGGSAQTGAGYIGIAIDMDNKKIWYTDLSGNYFNSGDPANGTNAAYDFSSTEAANGAVPFIYFATNSGDTGSVNFGQQPFSYSAPAGFKSICSANLPDPTIKLPNKHFDSLLYTGQDTSSLYNVTGLEFQPDWVWGKARNDTIGHILFDAVRGEDKQLESDITDAEVVRGSAAYRFLSNGFAVSTVGNLNNPVNYVAWNWNAGGSTVTNTDGTISTQVRANTTAGFSIVTYTGDGNTSATIGHGLGVAPNVIILKNRSSSADWVVMHSSTESYDGGNYKHKPLKLNTNDALVSILGLWATPNSSTQSISDAQLSGGNRPLSNASGDNYVAYCFSGVAGYSKFGTFGGNGSSNGTFIYTGFRPAYVMLKRTNSSEGWAMFDNKRDPDNVIEDLLEANTNAASITTVDWLDFLSNGIKHRTHTSNVNNSGSTYIYLAFAESPFKYSRAR